jgi:hypothetical protein
MLRRRSSGVARHSQHMLGHAMDFFIPEVPLEQIRYAGLRLQRGGVGFYPTSGSPFVHLDTGGIRHWPRMSHAQLAKVFPDGRTVHIPSDGKPLKNYELALADVEKRRNGSDAATVSKKPSLFASLFARFGGQSSEDDEEAAAPATDAKPATVVAAATSAKSADPVPMPRSKPVAATLQLASADAQIVPAPKHAAAASTDKAERRTPADIINARGFWGDEPTAPRQATPAQIAALRAREAVSVADPRPTASVTEVFKRAMAYAPAAHSPVDRANIVAASAPIPHSVRPVRNAAAAATRIDTVVAKGVRRDGGMISTSARLAAAGGDNVWMRVVMLAPSASRAMSTTVFGDTDMRLMRRFFVKPQAAITMTFSSDPLMGMTTGRFTGSAITRLETQSFVLHTAELH